MPEAVHQLLPARRRAVRGGGRFNLIFSEMINNSGGVVRERKRSNPTFFPFLSTGCQLPKSHESVSPLVIEFGSSSVGKAFNSGVENEKLDD